MDSFIAKFFDEVTHQCFVMRWTGIQTNNFFNEFFNNRGLTLHSKTKLSVEM